MKKTTELFSFLEFLHKFQAIKRKIEIPSTDQQENDVEHSYFLTMLAWYIMSAVNPDLKKGPSRLSVQKVMKLSMIHDLLEVIPEEDIGTFDEEKRSGKAEKERAYLKKVEEILPTFPVLHQLIKEYITQSSPESKYVHSLDKIIGVLYDIADGGKSLHAHNPSITKKVYVSKKKAEITFPFIAEIFESEVMPMVEKIPFKNSP